MAGGPRAPPRCPRHPLAYPLVGPVRPRKSKLTKQGVTAAVPANARSLLQVPAPFRRRRAPHGRTGMRPETIAIHSGFDADPATKAVAVPIYQTVSYAFDSAAHGAALFDLEVEGFRYTRIGNPTNAVLEQRLADLEGGIDALVTSSGQAAMYYTALNLIEPGYNMVSVPQLYGTTHT